MVPKLLTGTGVRIGVIDSGVHPGHPHIRFDRLIGTASVAGDGSIDEHAGAALDRLGHGTAVTAAIQEKAPQADLFIVRVFHDALRTTGAALIAAIDWCATQGVDLINLSLGSTNEAHRVAFDQAARRALARGALLIGARTAEGIACYPGSLRGVIGVDLDWDCPRDRYGVRLQGHDVAYVASGYPRPIEGAPLHRNLHGISFAVAQMTGFAALACEDIGRTGLAGAPEAGVRRRLEEWYRSAMAADQQKSPRPPRDRGIVKLQAEPVRPRQPFPSRGWCGSPRRTAPWSSTPGPARRG